MPCFILFSYFFFTAFLETITPLFQPKRFRGKINIQKPQKPHFERQKFLEVATPYFINPNKNIPDVETCNKDLKYWKEKNMHIENPYQKIIAKELYDQLDGSKLVGFYHKNPMAADVHFQAFAAFKKAGMLFKNYGKKTMEMAVKGSRFETILEFYCSSNMIVFSKEGDVKKLLKINKKFPQIVLLGIYFLTEKTISVLK